MQLESCGCRVVTLAPSADELEPRLGGELRVTYVALDFGEYVFRYLRASPTTALFRNGRVVWSRVGALDGEDVGAIRGLLKSQASALCLDARATASSIPIGLPGSVEEKTPLSDSRGS